MSTLLKITIIFLIQPADYKDQDLHTCSKRLVLMLVKYRLLYFEININK
jgi:hypothetical protein